LLGRLGTHVRRQFVGYVALFVALGGTTYAAATIGSGDIKSNAVLSRHIKNGEIKNFDLGAKAVGTAKLQARAITAAKVANGAVTGPKLARGAVTGLKVADGSLTASDIDTSTLPRAFRSLSAVLGPNETKSLTIGNLTFSETADATGACNGMNLTTGSKAATVGRPDGVVVADMANHTVGITSAGNSSGFYVIANFDGTDNVLATVAQRNLTGGQCLTWGGIGLI
jgi:hypothetical protein